MLDAKGEEELKELLKRKEITYPENYDAYIQQVLEKLTEKEEKSEND